MDTPETAVIVGGAASIAFVVAFTCGMNMLRGKLIVEPVDSWERERAERPA